MRGTTDVGDSLGGSPQWASNWPKRGVSREGAEAAQLKYGINALWIRLNRGPMFVGQASQTERLSVEKLDAVLSLVEGAIKDSRKRVPSKIKATMIKRVYESPHALTSESADTVRSALAGILETLGDE